MRAWKAIGTPIPICNRRMRLTDLSKLDFRGSRVQANPLDYMRREDIADCPLDFSPEGRIRFFDGRTKRVEQMGQACLPLRRFSLSSSEITETPGVCVTLSIIQASTPSTWQER